MKNFTLIIDLLTAIRTMIDLEKFGEKNQFNETLMNKGFQPVEKSFATK